MFINKEELLEAIERKYGDLNDDSGSYSRTENGYEWLSIKRIVDIINNCEWYDEYD